MSNDTKHSTDKVGDHEFEAAIDLCLKHRRSWLSCIAVSKNEIMPELVKAFGETKAKMFFNKISGYEDAYHSYRRPPELRLTLVEENELAKQEFLRSNPDAPARLVSEFVISFCHARR